MIKQILMIVCIGMMLTSCVQEGHSKDPPTTISSDKDLRHVIREHNGFRVAVFKEGGCEYLLFTLNENVDHEWCVTHKGDCPNPIHQQQQQQNGTTKFKIE